MLRVPKGSSLATVWPGVMRMPRIDAFEEEALVAYDEGALTSVATAEELAELRVAASATVRLWAGDQPVAGQAPAADE